ncbi:MAG: hypothetical protein WCK90_01635 [archaeon]
MNFKNGAQVAIVRTTGSDETYYHKGDTSRVALGTRGKVKAIISDDKILLNLEGRVPWFVHPNEIKLLAQSKEELSLEIPGIETLPRHPLFDLSKNQNVFVVNGKVYTPSEKEEGSNFFVEKRFILSDRKNPLREVADLSTLDALLEGRIAKNLGKISEHYAEIRLAEITSKDMDRSRLSVPQLIYLQVFPYLRTTEFEANLDVVFGEGRRTPALAKEKRIKAESARELESFVARAYERVEAELKNQDEVEEVIARSKKDKTLDAMFGYREQKAEPKANESASYLKENFVIMDGAAYSLRKTDKISKKGLTLNGEQFEIADKYDSEDIESKALNAAAAEVRKAGLAGLTEEKIKDKLRETDVELLNFTRKETFEEGKDDRFGFEMHNGEYFVFINVPAIVYHNPRTKEFYHLEENKVGVRVFKDGNNLACDETPVLLSRAARPYAMGGYGDFGRSICFGHNALPTSGRDAGDLIAKKLRRTREILINGLRNKDQDDYNASGKNYSSQRISAADARRLGIPIVEGGRA